VQRGTAARRWKVDADETPEPVRKCGLRADAYNAADGARDETEQDEMCRIQPQHRGLARTEAAHHRAGVEVALEEAARGKSDRDCG
jgi:hypothetical protein